MPSYVLAAKIQPSKSVLGEGTRRKPLGTVNFQSANTVPQQGGKHYVTDKKDCLGASKELVCISFYCLNFLLFNVIIKNACSYMTVASF
jgi:hypothetical protein